MIRKYLKLLLVSLILLCLLAGFTSCATPPGEKVDIPDEVLREALKDAVGKSFGSLYTSKLEKLTELSYVPHRSTQFQVLKYIYDISGLEYCVNLTKLNLSGNLITDISPLSHLTALERFNLVASLLANYLLRRSCQQTVMFRPAFMKNTHLRPGLADSLFF